MFKWVIWLDDKGTLDGSQTIIPHSPSEDATEVAPSKEISLKYGKGIFPQPDFLFSMRLYNILPVKVCGEVLTSDYDIFIAL